MSYGILIHLSLIWSNFCFILFFRFSTQWANEWTNCELLSIESQLKLLNNKFYLICICFYCSNTSVVFTNNEWQQIELKSNNSVISDEVLNNEDIPNCVHNGCNAWYESAYRFHCLREHQLRKHMDLFGFVWICLDLFGFVWICLDLFGFVWICFRASVYWFAIKISVVLGLNL
jgi:hypothetical protein